MDLNQLNQLCVHGFYDRFPKQSKVLLLNRQGIDSKPPAPHPQKSLLFSPTVSFPKPPPLPHLSSIPFSGATWSGKQKTL